MGYFNPRKFDQHLDLFHSTKHDYLNICIESSCITLGNFYNFQNYCSVLVVSVFFLSAIHKDICHDCKTHYYLEPSSVQTAILSKRRRDETCCPVTFTTKPGFRFELSVVSRSKRCNFRVLENNWQNEKDVCVANFLSVTHRVTVFKDWNVTILYRGNYSQRNKKKSSQNVRFELMAYFH